jgi:hypothetical protein
VIESAIGFDFSYEKVLRLARGTIKTTAIFAVCVIIAKKSERVPKTPQKS